MLTNFCPYCNSGLREIIRHGAPRQGSASHYSRIECVEFGHFVRLLKSASHCGTVTGLEGESPEAAGCNNLTQWQAQFVASVTQRGIFGGNNSSRKMP